MSFQKPGSRSQSAFGVSFKSRNRPSQDDNAPSTSGRQEPVHDEPPFKRAKLSLPVARYKRQILYLLETHATVVIVGETGCGKTTQIPQYLHKAGWTAEGYQVVCTQPRRMAAVTVAQRVAQEMGVDVGGLVGYGVRFEDITNKASTKIKYVTDGVLLREMMDDPLLTKYSVIMVDEAHERSLATDTLLGLLKKVQRRRHDLRLIISSATLEVDKLVAFFDTATIRRHKTTATAGAGAGAGVGGSAELSRTPAVLSVEGRTHPVQVHYLLEPCPDYIKAAVETVVDIHREDVPGDVLLFLTGQEECEAVVKLLDEEARKLARSRLKYKMLPLPLYAGLPGAHQRLVYEPTPRGYRKVIAATNIAETSLTIEGVVYVVDSCYVKQRAYNPILGLESLLVAPTSQASAAQRAGRAGRVRPGHAFRLCTEEAFSKLLPVATVPEMQRSDLAGLLLQLKILMDSMLRSAFPIPITINRPMRLGCPLWQLHLKMYSIN
eukprot:jgi/Chrzof1/5753/Cz16g14170.t1